LYKIVCFELHEPRVREVLTATLPEGFWIEIASEGTLEEKIRMVEDADFILAGSGPVEGEVLRHGVGVRLIQKMGIGTDRIDLAVAAEMGIPVAIAAGANSIPVAEHALLLMLAVYRKLPYVDRTLRAGQWVKNQMRAESRFLAGKTVGLVGLGHVARRLCGLLHGFSTRILYYDIVRPSEEEERAFGVEFSSSLEALLAASDVVSLHVTLTPQTRHLIDERNIRASKPGAILINTSRGTVVSEAALYDALVNGPLAGAGLDVFEVEPPPADLPLFHLDNVVVTPHVGGAVLDNVAIVAGHSFDNMVRMVRGEPLPADDLVVT
jgi:phosphoglycerate dehydrogenase-like enzyme